MTRGAALQSISGRSGIASAAVAIAVKVIISDGGVHPVGAEEMIAHSNGVYTQTLYNQ